MRAAPNTEQHLRSFAARAERGSPSHPSKLQFYDIAATAARRFIASGARLGEHTLRNNQSTQFCRARAEGQPAASVEATRPLAPAQPVVAAPSQAWASRT